MQAISYYLTLPFLYFFSALPLKLLYFLSDVLVFPVLYYVAGYRKEVVRTNLLNAFPEKTDQERNAIEKKFYRYLSDLFVETIKVFTISKRELLKRMEYQPEPEAFSKWFREGRSYVLTLGHFGNYEWLGTSLDLGFTHKGTGPFRQMSNPYFNRLFLRSRSKYGTILYPTYQTVKEIVRLKGQPINVTLANDQAAPPKKSYWTTFLNQDTSFFVGTEKIARDFDMPVVFGKIQPKKRGYYKVSYEIISEHPAEAEPGEIMEKHARLLENQILEHPEFWLWSHRRWKHKRPDGVDVGFRLKKN